MVGGKTGIFLNVHKLGGHNKRTLGGDRKSTLKIGGGGENEVEGWIVVSLYKSIVCTLKKGDEDFQMTPYWGDKYFFVKMKGGGGGQSL